MNYENTGDGVMQWKQFEHTYAQISRLLRCKDNATSPFDEGQRLRLATDNALGGKTATRRAGES